MIDFISNISPIYICDIGASPIDKTDFIDDLYNNSNSKIIGFEPNTEEYNKLEKRNPKKNYYNYAIGDGSEKILNICRGAGMTSFLEPNINYLKNFSWFDTNSEIIKKEKVKTEKLDSLKEKIDFLKIDVQGYESEIIKYGEDITVVSYGSILRLIDEASKLLTNFNISIEIIDIQTLIPFDINHMITKSISKTNRVVFIDEDVPGGTTAYMMQQVIEKQNAYIYLDSPPKTLASKEHRPAYTSDGDYFSKPNIEDIFQIIYNMMNEYNPHKYPKLQ